MKKNILIIILCITVLLLSGYILWNKIQNTSVKDSDKEMTKEEIKETELKKMGKWLENTDWKKEEGESNVYYKCTIEKNEDGLCFSMDQNYDSDIINLNTLSYVSVNYFRNFAYTEIKYDYINDYSSSMVVFYGENGRGVDDRINISFDHKNGSYGCTNFRGDCGYDYKTSVVEHKSAFLNKFRLGEVDIEKLK